MAYMFCSVLLCSLIKQEFNEEDALQSATIQESLVEAVKPKLVRGEGTSLETAKRPLPVENPHDPTDSRKKAKTAMDVATETNNIWQHWGLMVSKEVRKPLAELDQNNASSGPSLGQGKATMEIRKCMPRSVGSKERCICIDARKKLFRGYWEALEGELANIEAFKNIAQSTAKKLRFEPTDTETVWIAHSASYLDFFAHNPIDESRFTVSPFVNWSAGTFRFKPVGKTMDGAVLTIQVEVAIRGSAPMCSNSNLHISRPRQQQCPDPSQRPLTFGLTLRETLISRMAQSSSSAASKLGPPVVPEGHSNRVEGREVREALFPRIEDETPHSESVHYAFPAMAAPATEELKFDNSYEAVIKRELALISGEMRQAEHWYRNHVKWKQEGDAVDGWVFGLKQPKTAFWKARNHAVIDCHSDKELNWIVKVAFFGDGTLRILVPGSVVKSRLEWVAFFGKQVKTGNFRCY
ncbi:hypothetical protein BDV96DRAFT_597016 [Lophiotrema nucula]|uniref:Uncharacterized protein n=1 Tax=Lophiotrema nucula TaxID=690887 RepID=A0A6A5ZF83_9PLEO|nr:hypothetical protein BDV96DRAFT_597016 [Lophiotrema nucula]